MARLKVAIIREYEDDEDISMEVYNPRNTQAVELYFRGEKMAKVMGNLAAEKPKESHQISGVLIKRDFNYHLVNPGDLANYTELATSVITERMSIPCTAPFSLLYHHLNNLSPDAMQCFINEKPAIKVFNDQYVQRICNLYGKVWQI